MLTQVAHKGGAVAGLQEIIADAQRDQARRRQLADFASELLGGRGGLVITRPHIRQPVAEGEVGLKPGVSFLRATHPVEEEEGGFFVALRQGMLHHGIELISVADDDPQHVAEAGADDLLAIFGNQNMVLPGIEQPTPAAMGFTHNLLQVIRRKLDPVIYDVTLPPPRYYDGAAPPLGVCELADFADVTKAAR